MEISSSRVSALRMNRIEPITGRNRQQAAAKIGNFSDILSARSAPAEPRKPVVTQASAKSLAVSPKAAAATVTINQMQQNWLDANPGSYASLMADNLTRGSGFNLNQVQIQWNNLSNGRPEGFVRSVGTVDRDGAQQLASLLGGTVVQAQQSVFGSSVRDPFIRLSNGHMIDASVLANSLNQARGAADPFSATQNVLEVYKAEAAQYNPSNSGSFNLVHS